MRQGLPVVLVAVFPILDLFFGLVAGNAVALLHLADHLLTLAVDHVQIIVRQFAPGFLDLALELLPVATDGVFVHENLLE